MPYSQVFFNLEDEPPWVDCFHKAGEGECSTYDEAEPPHAETKPDSRMVGARLFRFRFGGHAV